MKQLLTTIWSPRKFLQQMIVVIASVLLITQLFTAPALATSVVELPQVQPGDSTYIVDHANVLSFLNKGNLEGTLSDLAKKTGNEVRFVTIRRLDYGETAESFTQSLFDQWFPDAEAQKNQTVLFLDTKTNTTAIHSGAQTQNLLPENTAESVAQETMLVPIREGNYNQAFADAADRLVAVLTGQPDPGPPVLRTVSAESNFKTAEETNDRSATFIVIGLLIAATVIPMVTYFMYQGQS